MRRDTTQVVIVGAGPSGAIAASLLHEQNIDVIVVEKSKFPRFSIGESLLPACMSIIEDAGMLSAVKQHGFQRKTGAAFRRGDFYTTFDFAEKFTPGHETTYQVQRGDFDKILADTAEEQGVKIRYEHQVQAIDLGPERPILTVTDHLKRDYCIETDFILDASGFARVLPRLLNLEVPSSLPHRKAVFTHIEDNIEPTSQEFDREKILITVHPNRKDVWYWLIPFSNGRCSVGVVGRPDFFENYPENNISILQQLISEEPSLAKLLSKADFSFPSGELGGYSANVKQLASNKFALLGNAGEFLDPVFSSGVTIAMKSAQVATGCLAKQVSGRKVDWEEEYVKPLKIGIDTFRTYVEAWYDQSFQDVVFHDNPNPRIKQMICSILAGYAWDTDNPYVRKSRERLNTLVEIVRQ